MEAEYRDRGAILKRTSGLRCRDTRPNFQPGVPKPFAKADQIHRARSPEVVSNLRKPGSEYQATDQFAEREQLRRVRRRVGTSQRHFFDSPDSEDCRRATSPRSAWKSAL